MGGCVIVAGWTCAPPSDLVWPSRCAEINELERVAVRMVTLVARPIDGAGDGRCARRVERLRAGVPRERLFSMKKVKVATLTTSNLSRLGGAFLLGSMSLACGSSTGTTPVDQGTSGDGGSSGGSASSGGAGGMTDGMTSVGSMDAPGSIDAVDAENVDVPLSPGAVNLGTAGDFVILSKSGISTVPTSAVTGNLGVSPAAATYITGFSLTAD